MDETCDIIISDNSKSCTLSNDFIRKGYESLSAFQSNGLEMYSDTYREIAVRKHNAHLMVKGQTEEWKDETLQLEYRLSKPSDEYCFHLINQIAILIQQRGVSAIGGYRSNYPVRAGSMSEEFLKEEYLDNPIELIRNLFHFKTLIIKSSITLTPELLRDLASSYVFYYMYNKSIAIKEYYDSVDLFQVDKDRYFSKKQMQNVIYSSKRINPALINYYTYAVEAREPFTAFISYYHVIEHFYEAIYKKELIKTIQEQLSQPDFSDRNDEQIFDLAKRIIKKNIQNEENGKGNEIESLKYVLKSYVDITKLQRLITEIDPNAVKYYKDNDVPFISQEHLKIPWSDTNGANTVIAKRIYKTRNALVHSKSEQADKQYSPYTDIDALMNELPLIRAVAELVIINSSEDIVI